MISKNKKTAIILLNWNNYEDTIDCIRSLKLATDDGDEIIVVDNGSTDTSIKKLQTVKGLTIIENSENLGFAGGNNVGILYSLEKNFDFIFLLNNDTIVSSSFLWELKQAAVQFPNTSIFCPKIYYHHDPSKIWFGGGRLRSLTGVPLHQNFGEVDSNPEDKKAKRIDFITGCAMFIRSSCWRQVGLLDERFFIYCEDVDWSMRAKNLNYECLFIPQSKIWHKEGASLKKLKSSGEFRRYKLSTRNLILLHRKHSSITKYLMQIVAVILLVVFPNFLRLFVRLGPYAAIGPIFGLIEGMFWSKSKLN